MKYGGGHGVSDGLPRRLLRKMMDWREVSTRHCGVAAATEIVGDRWTQLVLRDVFFGVRRYNDLLDHLGVSTTVLADRLNKLVDGGILVKVPYQDDGQRHRYEYQLTERGFSLLYVQLALAEFGYQHLVDDENRLVSMFDRATGQRVTVALVREDGTPVDLGSLELRINESAAAV